MSKEKKLNYFIDGVNATRDEFVKQMVVKIRRAILVAESDAIVVKKLKKTRRSKDWRRS